MTRILARVAYIGIGVAVSHFLGTVGAIGFVIGAVVVLADNIISVWWETRK